MRKIDKIDCCGHCPLKSKDGMEFICKHITTEGCIIKDLNNISDFCPLPEDT